MENKQRRQLKTTSQRKIKRRTTVKQKNTKHYNEIQDRPTPILSVMKRAEGVFIPL